MTKKQLSKAMSELGKRTSKKKAAASRANGKLGGITKAQRAEWEARANYGSIAGNSHNRRVARRSVKSK